MPPDRLPTADEINVYDSLDERSAVKHFLGKDKQEAEALFRDNFLKYEEYLMFMGPKAFHFYLPAAVNYLLGPHSDGDSDAVNSFCGLIEFCLDCEPEKLNRDTAALVRQAIHSILQTFERYDCHPEIDGDLPERYQAALSRLSR